LISLFIFWSRHFSFLTRKVVAAMCRVRKPGTENRPDRSLPAHSRHRALQAAKKLAAIMVVLALD